MARIRYIKPDFFDSEQVASCSAFARLLFVGLWTIADREGRFECSPRRLKAKLFPYDDVHVERLLAELYGAIGKDGKRLAEFYRVDGALYGWMPNFTKHQRPHPNEAASVIPAPAVGVPESPDSWNVTSARDGVIANNSTTESCNVTSPNDASLQCRGEQNGEGTERDRTERAHVGANRRSSYRDPHGMRTDPNVADSFVVGPGQIVGIPTGWWTKAKREYALTDADLDAVVASIKGYVQRHGFEDGGKRLPWLDARLAEFRAERAKPNDGYRPASEWIAERDRLDAEIPVRTPEQVRELLRRPVKAAQV